MKKCPYCSAEYPDDAAVCAIDQTSLMDAAQSAPAETSGHGYDFASRPPADCSQDLVTLMTCETLLSADLAVSQLEAAGIKTFIPDQSLMQMIGFNLNTYGYVRVQVAPQDYDAAKTLLSGKEIDV